MLATVDVSLVVFWGLTVLFALGVGAVFAGVVLEVRESLQYRVIDRAAAHARELDRAEWRVRRTR